VKKIVLISCVKSKRKYPAKAKDLYTSTLFQSNLQYAYQLKPDAIYILSAKYGLSEIWVEVSGQPILYDGRHGALMFMREVDAPQGKPLVGYPEK